MKKVSSKILAILLSFAVVLSMMPGMAMADGDPRLPGVPESGATYSMYTDSNQSVGDTLYAFVGDKYGISGYIQDESNYYNASFSVDDQEDISLLGINSSPDPDYSYGYGASIEFTPKGKGVFNLNLINGNTETVKSTKIYTCDLSIYLGNDTFDSSNVLETGKEYTLNSYISPVDNIAVPESIWEFENMTGVTVKSSSTKMDFGGGYVYDSGNITFTVNAPGTYKLNLTNNKEGSEKVIYKTISFKAGNSTGGLEQASLKDIKATNQNGNEYSNLFFFGSEYEGTYWESSMLGNNWYGGNELKVNVGDTKASLYDPQNGKFNYLSAYVEMPESWNDSDVNVKWYYSNIYSADGKGYNEFVADENNSWKGLDGYYTPTIDGNNIRYYNIVPNTSVGGTYYYYVDISYTDDSGNTYTLSSKSSQATVIVGNASLPVIPSGQISVSFAIEGFGSLPGMSTHTVSASGGSTAADLVKNQLTANGYTYEWSSSMGGYLASVTKYGITYSEFTAGPNSGWMYRVNGIAPQIGMSGYTLQEGDEVVLYYTGDYTKDPYSTSGSTQTEPTISITDKDGKDASSMGSVRYDASSNCVDISPASGYKVSDVKVNGVSKGAVTKLEGIKATDRIEVVFEAASAESETPAVSDQTAKIIAGVQAIKPKVTNTRLKSGIKVYWKKNSSYKVSYYQVYRKTGKNGTYKLIYTTKLPTTLKITNVKNLKKGKTYYYRVRGVRVIDGKKYYTKWSNYTYRKFR